MQRSDPAAKAAPLVTFSHPIRAITTMVLVCVLVGAGLWFMHHTLEGIFLSNPWLNGLILFTFALGVIACFWQMFSLAKSVQWIEASLGPRDMGGQERRVPSLLAPLAALLRAQPGRGLLLSATSSRSILDSVAQRIDEARDITRYLTNLLVFLGLLGTFWGLATTVPAVVETIRSLSPEDGSSSMDIFAKLMTGLEGQLGGMGTAFSSSLLGLGGSLVLGLLELFAGHGQNRFYRELEEWLSSITRIGLGLSDAGDGDALGGDYMAMQVMDDLTGQLETLQGSIAQTQGQTAMLEARLSDLTLAIGQLAQAAAVQNQTQNAATAQISADDIAALIAGQNRLIAAIEADQQARAQGVGDAEARMRLRSIDVQMLRILEEISAGRQETVADLRHDLAQLTMAMRQMMRQANPVISAHHLEG